MPSGLCHQCVPPKGKPINPVRDIKKVKMFVDAHTSKPVYLCAPCAKELGYV